MTIYRDKMRAVFSEYMASDQWRFLRRQLLEREDGKCQFCYEYIENGFVAHHGAYINWGAGNDAELKDLVFVCASCHGYIHNSPSSGLVPFWAKKRNGDMPFSEIVAEKHPHWETEDEAEMKAEARWEARIEAQINARIDARMGGLR